jgi:hypothetical protein
MMADIRHTKHAIIIIKDKKSTLKHREDAEM